MKNISFVLLILLAVAMLSACSGVSDSSVDFASVQERLYRLDAYKKSIPASQTSQAYNASKATFRGFEFGTSKEMITGFETLTLSTEYSDALDYTGSELYSYDMLLTYWFNSNGQFYRASLSMQNDAFFDTVNNLMAGLRGDYGEPSLSGYYDTANAVASFDSDQKALDAVEGEGVYYYAAFADAFGTQVELFAENGDTSYDYWVCYTDYTYFDA